MCLTIRVYSIVTCTSLVLSETGNIYQVKVRNCEISYTDKYYGNWISKYQRS